MLATLQSAGFSTAILLHTVTAIAALVIGAVVFLGRKGSPRHRMLGRTWALLMLVVILSSFFIKMSGSFSWIHALSVGSLVALALAVYHIRKGNVKAHRHAVIGLYSGGLVLAGVFTLLPSRLLGSYLWRLFA